MHIIEKLQIDFIAQKYGRIILLIGLTLFTFSAFILGLFGVLDYSLLVVSIIGWIILLLYIVFELYNDNIMISCNNSTISPIKDVQHHDTPRMQKILSTIFLLLLISILVLLQIYDTRPLAYFILTSLLAGVVVFSVVISNSQKTQYSNLIKTIILGFISMLSIFKVYYYIGWDIWVHDVWNRLLVESGFLSDFLGKEESTALQHIAVAISDIVVGVDTHFATIIIHIIPGVILSTFVYIIAGKYFDQKSAILSLIIFITSVSTISWFSGAVTTSYASILYLPLMYVLFRLIDTHSTGKTNRYIFMLLYVLFIFVISVTHMFSIFIILFLIAAFYVASCLSERRFINRMLPLVLIAYIWVFGFWIFGAGGFGFNMFSSLVVSSIDVLINPTIMDTTNPNIVDGVSSNTPNIIDGVSSTAPDIIDEVIGVVPGMLSTSVSNLQVMNQHLSSMVSSVYSTTAPDALRIVFTQLWVPISFSVFVLLLWLFFKSNDKKRLWYLLFPYFGALAFFAGIYIIYPAMVMRISAFITLFVALAIAYIFYTIIHKSPQLSWIKSIVLTVIIVVFCMFCLTQNPIAADNMFWYEETSVPNGITNTEYTGMVSIVSVLPDNTKLLSDANSMPVLMGVGTWEKYMHESEIPSIINRWSQAKWRELFSSDTQSGVIFREKLLKSTTQLSTTYGKSENEKYSELIKLSDGYIICVESQFNRLYDNSEVYLYRI